MNNDTVDAIAKVLAEYYLPAIQKSIENTNKLWYPFSRQAFLKTYKRMRTSTKQKIAVTIRMAGFTEAKRLYGGKRTSAVYWCHPGLLS